MTSNQAFIERNRASRQRLHDVLDRVTEEMMGRKLANGWSVGATLAHIAFWDRWVVARWDQYDRDGEIMALPDGTDDLGNSAGIVEWQMLTPAQVSELVRSSADAIDRRIAALSPAAIAHAVETGRPAMLDRSLHRDPHLDEIDELLGR